MSELFNDMQGISNPAENAQRNTPEDEAFRLAKKIYPIGANSLREAQVIQVELLEYNRKELVELARFVNPDLRLEHILEAAVDFCSDYNDYYNDDNDMYCFDAAGMLKFLKWCEPREKDLFN